MEVSNAEPAYQTVSVEAMSWVLNHSRSKGVVRLVLLGIANHAGDGGAWPSQATLARYANCTDRTVRTALLELVELGELIILSRKGGTRHTDPRHRPNLYEITLSTGSDHDRKTASARSQLRPEMNVGCDRKTASDEPSLEPPSNKSPSDLTAIPPEPVGFLEFCARNPNDSPKVLRWRYAEPS